MKKILALVLCICLLMAGFSLTGQISVLEEDIKQKNLQIQQLEEDILQLENMPQNLYTEALAKAEAGKYEEAINQLSSLCERYPTWEGVETAREQITVVQSKSDEASAEAEKTAEDKLKSAQDKARSIIRVTKLTAGYPDYAGGIDLYIGFTNMSDKPIKYVSFTLTPFNAVGDKVTCSIRDYSTTSVQDTGPYNKGEGLSGNGGYWRALWYNSTIKTVVLNEIEIEYMDGTTVTLKGNDVTYVQY